MELKYFSWFAVVVCLLLNIFGWFLCCLTVLAAISLILGLLTMLYLQYEDVDQYLAPDVAHMNPLDGMRPSRAAQLGLNLDCDTINPIHLVPLPNDIPEQTESSRHGARHHHRVQALHVPGDEPIGRKKSLIDSGIELLFKKSPAGAGPSKSQNFPHSAQHHTPNHHQHSFAPSLLTDFHRHRSEVVLDKATGKAAATTKHGQQPEEKSKWRPFETIKIYTERRKSHDQAAAGVPGDRRSDVSVGEEVNFASPSPIVHPDAHLFDEYGSPKKKMKTMLCGHKPIDQLLHTMIDYVLRDYIDSWFNVVTDNREFSDFRTRTSVEESLQNVCARIKNTQWIPLITNKIIEDVATHARLYRLAGQAVSGEGATAAHKEANKRQSPQRRSNRKEPSTPSASNAPAPGLRHRRNKSDTDLRWHLAGGGAQRTVANSKFYNEPIDEKALFADPEARLNAAFFDISDLYRDQCLDENKLEKYLTHAMETLLYFTIPAEDFKCLPLRNFLSTMLANVVCKPILELLSDPDFINLMVARLVPKETINSEFFLKLIRHCSDLSELRACRQFVTKEMDLKYKDSPSSSALNSLRYAQKVIDLRLSHLQNNKNEISQTDRGAGDKAPSNLPILTLEELLTKELALSYYLDYLSILNLQKYVIFYLTAVEWKVTSTRCILELQTNKAKSGKDEIMRTLRDKADTIYKEYLVVGSTNCLQIDAGLVEALHIKITNPSILPENTWFDSICKFVYEKLKNEDIFLNQFYQSSSYKKLLLELEVCGQTQEPLDLASLHTNDTNSDDTNSADISFADVVDDETDEPLRSASTSHADIPPGKFLDVTGGGFRHSRSHSDCTGLVQNVNDIVMGPFQMSGADSTAGGQCKTEAPPRARSPLPFTAPSGPIVMVLDNSAEQQKVFARIINTAILCEGQYAVYAIQVSVIEDMVHKSWHVYRRYSKFLELKKILVKRYSSIARVPFPAKKTFQNTDRHVLEHRMVVLNEFLRVVCQRAEDNAEILAIVRDFMEPDTNDKKMHGGTVIRTIETIVNPIRSGMRTIKNMPDTLVGGIAKILLGKGPMKEASFLDAMPAMEHSWEYPALTSALNLLDEVFDLQSRSQWLRRGIINRLLGAPWVSHAANKRIIHAAKSVIEVDKVERLMNAVLNNLWPGGNKHKKSPPREDNTKLRTRMAAKIALLSLLSDDLKHVVGSETTRSGLLNFFTMWQHRKLNLRLALVIFNHVLTTVYQTENLTKHSKD